MPITVTGDTSANTVEIDATFAAQSTGTVTLRGRGARVTICTNRACANLRIDLGDAATFEMAEGAYAAHLHADLRHGARATIGRGSFAIGQLRLFSFEGADIRIGADCLIGGGVLLMATDMHAIVDAQSGERINPAADILIGDHVWLGLESTVLKGTTIGAGSIVGLRSVVMGEFPGNCMILGYPARLVRSGVTWRQQL